MGPRILVAVAGIYGAIGIGLGAFGAHALKDRLPPERLGHLETAVRYLFTSIPGLLVTGVFAAECSGGLFEAIAGWSFIVGALVFSGSLVLLALTGVRRWGAVTPIGGVLLIVGWLAVAGAALMLPGSGTSGFLTLTSGC